MARKDDRSPETFDALRQRIRERFSDLSPHLQRIARSSLEEPNGFALNRIATIAGEIGVQPSTLIRFAKEFGYPGFSDLQKVFRQRLIEGDPALRASVESESASRSSHVDAGDILDQCVKAHVASLESLRRSIAPDALMEAVRMIRGANHIYVAGLRRSRPIASYMVYGLMRSERRCSMVDFGSGMASQQISNMSADDLLIAIAFPPYSQPVVDLVADASLGRRRIIAITDSDASPLARHATLRFLVGADAKSQFQPVSGAIGLAQTLIMASGR